MLECNEDQMASQFFHSSGFPSLCWQSTSREGEGNRLFVTSLNLLHRFSSVMSDSSCLPVRGIQLASSQWGRATASSQISLRALSKTGFLSLHSLHDYHSSNWSVRPLFRNLVPLSVGEVLLLASVLSEKQRDSDEPLIFIVFKLTEGGSS